MRIIGIQTILLVNLTGARVAATPSPNKRQKHSHEELASEEAMDRLAVPSRFDKLDPILASVIGTLPASDLLNEPFTPNLDPGVDWEVTPEGFWRLDKVIGRNQRNLVFSIQNDTANMIMYQHDCVLGGGASLIHPLVSRAAYTQAAGHMSAETRFRFISPPAALKQSSKTIFDISAEDFDACASSGATVRYAILETDPAPRAFVLAELAKLIWERVDGVKRFTQLFLIGARIIDSLKELHGRDIVHGNLNPAAIKIIPGDEGTVYARFTDFSLACWAHPATGASIHRFVRDGRTVTDDVWMSPNEIRKGQRHMYSKMDDVFRAVDIISVLVNNNATSPDPRISIHAEGRLREYKLFGPLFDKFVDRFKHDAPGILVPISNLMTLALLETPTPPYNAIARLFRQIASILDKIKDFGNSKQ